jgi:hypothetical protein
MNVLILTPDRVGSTLLQRLITVYMLRRDFGRPVINLHELTNGLIKYYNETMNQEVLGKPEGTDWGYFQSLDEIQELLTSVDHYKTSRLARYHLIRRQDNINDQIKFYEYLNRNFYIISCRRNNLLEHVLSWAITAHSKKLNVFSIQEKVNDFFVIYKNGITVTKSGLEKYLNSYVEYIKWSDTYFNIQAYFDYEKNMPNIEDFICNLDFMKGHKDNTWKDMFGQDFNSWNTCHRMLPNLLLHDRSHLKNTKSISILPNSVSNKNWQQIRGQDWPESREILELSDLPVNIEQELKHRLSMITVQVSQAEYEFFKSTLPIYNKTCDQLNQLIHDGFIIGTIPIKLQSLQEKKQIIQNFSQCVSWYNQWVEENNFGQKYTEEELDIVASDEGKILNQKIGQQIAHVSSKFLSG